jgi:hypothetical protein
MDIEHVYTEEQIADILTKPLGMIGSVNYASSSVSSKLARN